MGARGFSFQSFGFSVLCRHCGVLLLLTLAGCGPFGQKTPETPTVTVTDVYHGVEVSESYRWLEDFDDPDVQAWSDAQNAFARAYLDDISDRDEIHQELTRLSDEASTQYYGLRYAGGRLLATKYEPPAEQPYLVVLASPHDLSSERILVDLNTLDTNFTTAIDFYVPSLDGSLIAVSFSEKGSEHGTVYVYDVEAGTRLTDVVARVNGPTAGGDVAWNRDRSGFFYTRYPHPGERPDEDLSFYQQVYYHTLGTPNAADTYVLGKEFPRIAEIELATSDDGKYFLAEVSNGDGGEYAHYLRQPTGAWEQVTRFEDGVPQARFGPDGSLYLYSHHEAPHGRILRLPPGKTNLREARVAVAESDVTINDFLPTASRLYVVDILGGPSRVRILDSRGLPREPWSIDPISTISGLLTIADDKILFSVRSYTEPAAWFEYDPASGEAVRTAMFVESAADYSDVEVVREFATSKDGTKVPVNILRRKGIKLDGQNPTILYGYGGYGICMTPGFSATRSMWLAQGGVLAIANLRGGGEYGEEWHRQGNLTNKQNVFDDFMACAEHLIAGGYTNPSRLAIQGGSNGGLLMGAVLTQRPDLYRAVLSSVGIYDMLRVELDPNGEFNVTEFGTVKDTAQFRALYAYSPYHHVTDGTAYPAVLFTTGQHDGRVNPAHSRKMTARLQAATSSRYPILLRTSSQTGHGSGTSRSRRIDRDADTYAFLFRELGMRYGEMSPDALSASD